MMLDKTIRYTLTSCIGYFLIKLAITIDQNEIKLDSSFNILLRVRPVI